MYHRQEEEEELTKDNDDGQPSSSISWEYTIYGHFFASDEEPKRPWFYYERSPPRSSGMSNRLWDELTSKIQEKNLWYYSYRKLYHLVVFVPVVSVCAALHVLTTKYLNILSDEQANWILYMMFPLLFIIQCRIDGNQRNKIIQDSIDELLPSFQRHGFQIHFRTERRYMNLFSVGIITFTRNQFKYEIPPMTATTMNAQTGSATDAFRSGIV